MKALSAAIAIALAFSVTSLAEAKHAKRHKQVKRAPPAELVRAGGFSREPARMIQVGPGYWISSYGCVMDGGYGRLTPCDLTDHSD
jgi:hypothetical protein